MTTRLDDFLRPHVRPRTIVRVDKARPTPHLPPTASRFGGTPYMEHGEVWPHCTACRAPLSFIVQLDLRGTAAALPDLGLLTFYYCWSCFPQDPEVGPWALRTHPDPSDARALDLETPQGAEEHPLRGVSYEPGLSLPDWETAFHRIPEACTMAEAAHGAAPWQAYREAAERLTGPEDLGSVIGGYPRWLQGYSPPTNGARFLAAIDSVGDGISWGDAGLVYLFVDDDPARTPLLRLQSC